MSVASRESVPQPVLLQEPCARYGVPYRDRFALEVKNVPFKSDDLFTPEAVESGHLDQQSEFVRFRLSKKVLRRFLNDIRLKTALGAISLIDRKYNIISAFFLFLFHLAIFCETCYNILGKTGDLKNTQERLTFRSQSEGINAPWGCTTGTEIACVKAF